MSKGIYNKATINSASRFCSNCSSIRLIPRASENRAAVQAMMIPGQLLTSIHWTLSQFWENYFVFLFYSSHNCQTGGAETKRLGHQEHKIKTLRKKNLGGWSRWPPPLWNEGLNVTKNRVNTHFRFYLTHLIIPSKKCNTLAINSLKYLNLVMTDKFQWNVNIFCSPDPN